MTGNLAAVALAVVVAAADPAPLAFSEYFRAGSARLEPSAKLLALDGQHVRLTGFMAHMEDGPSGAFYLASRPVACDEGGAGTGDLPPDAVLVVVPWASGSEIPFLPGPLDVEAVSAGGAPLYRAAAETPARDPAVLSVVLVFVGGVPGP